MLVGWRSPKNEKCQAAVFSKVYLEVPAGQRWVQSILLFGGQLPPHLYQSPHANQHCQPHGRWCWWRANSPWTAPPPGTSEAPGRSSRWGQSTQRSDSNAATNNTNKSNNNNSTNGMINNNNNNNHNHHHHQYLPFLSQETPLFYLILNPSFVNSPKTPG